MYGNNDRLSITPTGVRASLDLPLPVQRPVRSTGMQPTTSVYPRESIDFSFDMEPLGVCFRLTAVRHTALLR